MYLVVDLEKVYYDNVHGHKLYRRAGGVWCEKKNI